jgi:hypothetical protein
LGTNDERNLLIVGGNRGFIVDLAEKLGGGGWASGRQNHGNQRPGTLHGDIRKLFEDGGLLAGHLHVGIRKNG